MFRAVSEAKAIAIAREGSSFLANWPAYLARINSETGSIEAVTSLADSGQGMTSFNRLEFSPDYSAAFGLGSDLVRIDLSEGELHYHRDMPAPGGRSLAVIDAERAATGSTQSAVIAQAGAEAPDCSISGIIAALASSPSGENLAAAVYDQETKSTELVMYSAADCSELRRWAISARSVFDIAWLSGSGLIASAENDGVLRFWQSATGDLVYSMPVEEGAGFMMHFSEDGRYLLTYTLWGDRTLRAYQRL
jgi:WD40 repeat protein